MANEIPLTDIQLPTQVHGVIAVTPVFVQPVKIVDNPTPVSIIGEVTVVEPIEITQPVDVNIISGVSLTVDQSFMATVVAEAIGTSPVLLLGTNVARKGFAIQATNQTVFVKLDTTVTTGLYSYELPKKGILEVENYCGPVAAVAASGSTTVMVTEKV
jgi:hypothetical protein